MKLLLLLFPLLCFAQQVRYDSIVETTNPACTGSSQCPLLAVPNAQIQVCTDVFCATPATTYQSASGSTCPINAQVTLAGTALCRTTTGPNGDFGFWMPAGTYYFTVRLPNGTRKGPYPLSLGSGGGGSGSVTSVALSLPSVFTVSGSPVTTAGTLTGTFPSLTGSQFLVSPTGGGPLATRSLVASEIVAAFSGCSGTDYLGADGACHASGSGTVTSVGSTFTGGIVGLTGSPITTSGTLAFTVAGTSGGVPYFSTSTAWTSSGVLGAGRFVLGGGAGSAPTSANLSGDATTSGSAAVTVVALNGTSLAGLATGLIKNTTATGVPSIGTSTDVIATFSGCSGIQYLGADGNCHNSTGFGYFLLSLSSATWSVQDCAAATPCSVQLGDTTSSQVARITSKAAITITGGSDTWYFYIDSSGTFDAGTSGSGTATCSNCSITVLGSAAFPVGSIPLYTATSSSGAWVSNGLTDYRAPLGNKPNTTAGAGLIQSSNQISLDRTAAFITASSQPTVTGCGTISSQTGGGLSGTFVTSGTSCTPVLTVLPTTTNGYACLIWDQTNYVAPHGNLSSTTTSATFGNFTTTASDVIAFQCAFSN